MNRTMRAASAASRSHPLRHLEVMSHHRRTRSRSALRIGFVQRGEYALPQEFVLLSAPAGGVGRPVLDLPADNGFLRMELVGGQVDHGAVGQPVPVMMPGLLLSYIDFAEDEVPAEQILDHQRRYAALTAAGVVGPPLVQPGRIAGVLTPGRHHEGPQLLYA